MNPRLRLVIVIAIVVIIIGVVAAVVVPTLNSPGNSGSGNEGSNSGNTSQTNQATNTPPPPTPTPKPVVEIVVAIQQIPRGFTIPPNAVTTRTWPEEFAPSSAIFVDSEDDISNLVIGKKARTDIFREQPILTSMLVEDLSTLANVGSDAAAILPNNRVAVSVPMDRITSVAYAIQPGDRVDVMVTLLFVDIDPVFQSIEPNRVTLVDPETLEQQEGIEGRFDGAFNLGGGVTKAVIIGPSEQQRPRMVTQRTVQEALVVWVGNFPIDGRIFKVVPPATPTPVPTAESGGGSSNNRNATQAPTPVPPRPDIITLGVSPQDAVVLTWMMEARLPITFALRSATSTSQVPTDPVNLQYITETFRIDIPGRLDYSIEPAPDSIRQLFIGNRISLKSS